MGTSTVGVRFFLGADCATSSASCVSLGSATFTASQSPRLPRSTAARCSRRQAGKLGRELRKAWPRDRPPVGYSHPGWGLRFPSRLPLQVPVTATVVAAPTAINRSARGPGPSWSPGLLRRTGPRVSGTRCLFAPSGQGVCRRLRELRVAQHRHGQYDMTATDQSQVCSERFPPGPHRFVCPDWKMARPYAVAVIAIDQGGGISALSPQAEAIPSRP